MNDFRFSVVCLLVFASLVITLLVGADAWQPKGINVELLKQIIYIVTPIIAALLLMVHSSANLAKLQQGQQEVKQVVAQGQQDVKQSAGEIAKAAVDIAEKPVELHIVEKGAKP